MASNVKSVVLLIVWNQTTQWLIYWEFLGCGVYKVVFCVQGLCIPGIGVEVLQNLQKFQVRAWKSYRTHRSAGYGRGSLTELTEAPGTGMEVFAELAEVPGTGMRMLCPYSYPYLGYCATGVQTLERFRVRVWMYLGTGNTWENTPGMVLYVPYRTQPWIRWPRYAL